MNDKTVRDGTAQDADLQARKRSRLSFLAIVAIAALPLIAAYVMYFFTPALAPAARSNEGTLIQPTFRARSLDPGLADFEGQWTLLLPIEAGSCTDACERALYIARQVNIALGKESSRVQRAMLQAAPDLEDRFVRRLRAEYPKMSRRVVSTAVFARLAETTGSPEVTGYIFLADPNGNVMMMYAPAQEGGDILEDLKHVLRLSNIG